MKTSAIISLMLMLLNTPQLSLGRTIPVRGLQQRFFDPIPPKNEYQGTHCGTARCRELGVVTKRVDIPVIPEGEAGAVVGGEASAGESAGEAAAGAAAAHAGTGGTARGGEVAAGAQTGGQLGEFGTAQSSSGKRPLDTGSDTGSPDAQPDAKNPKTGAGPGSDDGSAGAGPDAADDVLTGDDQAANSADPTGVLNIRTKGYTDITKTTVGNEDTYSVKVGGTSIDDIRINRAEKSITADDLNNDLDTTPNRARAWEVQMSLFVHESGMQPSDLESIHYDSVAEETSTQPTIDRIVARRGDSFSLSNGATGQDKQDFDDILATKLGRSSQSLLRNTPVGKQIVRLDVGIGSGADEDHSLGFFLG